MLRNSIDIYIYEETDKYLRDIICLLNISSYIFQSRASFETFHFFFLIVDRANKHYTYHIDYFRRFFFVKYIRNEYETKGKTTTKHTQRRKQKQQKKKQRQES